MKSWLFLFFLAWARKEFLAKGGLSIKYQILWEGHNFFEKTFHLNLTLLSNFKKSGRFFQTFWPAHNIWTLQKKLTVWWRGIGIKKCIYGRGHRKYRKNCLLRTLWMNQNFWQEKPIFSPSFLVPFTARKISTIASQTKQFLSSVKFRYS